MILLIIAVWLGALALFVVLRSNATKHPPKAVPRTQLGHREVKPPRRTVGGVSQPGQKAA